MIPVPTRGLRATLASLTLVALLAAPAARAQLGGGPGAQPPAHLLRLSAAPVTVAAGGHAEVVVRIAITDGWHINANPPSPDYMVATEVALAPASGLQGGAPVYPPAFPLKLGFEENPVSVYTGTAIVRVPLTAAASAPNGTHTLNGTVRFQGCNDQVCMPPTAAPFTVAVTVTGGASELAPTTAPATGDSAGRAPPAAESLGAAPAAPPTRPGAAAPPPSEQNRALAAALAKGGLWWFLALFLGGLALNLTPCVFPMLGITVSVFGARKQEPPLKVVLHALAYVLGIVVTYSALGVVAALTGGLFGSALQNPLVNVGLGVLFVVLALSLFGLYEMQPPVWLLQRLGGADATSLAGIFVSGLAVGVIAAPCVGPFVVAVLALIAQRGNALFGLQTMFTMSLGLGFPYLLLAVFSNLLQSLPRSGDWMLWVKKVFGVLLTSIGLYYVLIGLAPEYAPWVMPLALLLGGSYLGFVDAHGSKKRGFRVLKLALGVLAVAGGVTAVVTLRSEALRRAEGIRFERYSEAAMQAALAQGRPVILEFSASWCMPCHELDQSTFIDPRVIDATRRYVVFKVDLTRYDAPESQALRARYGVTGVPEVLFFAPDGQERHELRVIGFIPAGPFLERLNAGAPS